jgi:sugar/nucleoside kinase (ribokinase family)
LPAECDRADPGQVPVTEITCIGMAVVDVLAKGVTAMPAGGETVFVSGVSVVPGGDALNQSVALATLGHKVGLMTVVGDDWQGSLVTGYCRDHGVDVSGVAVTADYATTTTIVIIDDAGERSFISPRGGTAALYGIQHADVARLEPGLKVLSVGSLFCSLSLDLDLLPSVLSRARELGAITVADLVNDRADGSLDQIAMVLERLDYVVPSQAEAEFFAGSSEPVTAAEVFRKHGVKNVIIKLGRDGCYAVTPAGAVHVPAFDVPAVDTTGSGDNFVAGFVSGLVLGLPLEDALRRGNAAAALSVQAVGATSGAPDARQLDNALRTLAVRRPSLQLPTR